LKLLDIVWKIYATLRKLFAPGVPSWLRPWVRGTSCWYDEPGQVGIPALRVVVVWALSHVVRLG